MLIYQFKVTNQELHFWFVYKLVIILRQKFFRIYTVFLSFSLFIMSLKFFLSMNTFLYIFLNLSNFIHVLMLEEYKG